MIEHKEDVKMCEIATTHVIHVKDGGGVKVLTYIPADKVDDILTQLRQRDGQISIFTANALGHSIASTLALDDKLKRHQLAENIHEFKDPDYDFEELDDPRTWMSNEEPWD